MARAMNLGMPNIGPGRELKWALEGYWSGAVDADALARVARERRAAAWREQAAAGIDAIASNDFSLYDRMLDMCCLVGAVPTRFAQGGAGEAAIDADTAFAMARGADTAQRSVAPLEMTKWFDTNYHYLVPELGRDTQFRLSSRKPVAEFEEALALGLMTRPVLIGPVTFLRLSASVDAAFDPLALLPRLVPVYAQVLVDLARAGAEWIQLDEPCLVTDLSPHAQDAYASAYAALSGASAASLMVATYFGGLGDNQRLALGLPVAGLHIDAVRGRSELASLAAQVPEDRVLSVGVVDGRNVWRTDLRAALRSLQPIQDRLGDRLWVGPSCSLQHVPHDLDLETALDPQLRSWLAFAKQKLREIAALTTALNHGSAAVEDVLDASDRVVESRRAATADRAGSVCRSAAAVTDVDARRATPAGERARIQRSALDLPLLPTTTIGSFPQTPEIRAARRRHTAGELTDDEYRDFCRREIAAVIAAQDAVGLDVLVHGEPERNDMVQYFGERLGGFAATSAGWVQSYGARCVRPPILFGDVDRPRPITVDWSSYAQSLTARPVKGMLTGPVTILQWSFVRDDRPRAETCRQIALAVRDEVRDLEAAGIRIIQVDEPALREGLPLRNVDRDAYLAWATDAFRLATSGVADTTQIHTHMCYADFADIVDAIVALDADVISIEATRSRMAVLDDLARANYPAPVGPGVYDIHSPHVPSVDEMRDLIDRAVALLPADQIWVNPDCGLKTRQWAEVTPALEHMVAAAREARASLCDLVP